ncbi:Maf family protein [Pleionea sediminis]|uniref:Maf family protein n=1 Tax=Pleionea sediminis TaxID=2569479 RepID=UPI0011847884|nr:nucleoside triphosphate pyrophosphatase [Pleionea sediminis]
MKIILASASPYRAKQLTQLGISAEIIPAEIDETPQPGEATRALVKRLAREKASAVLEKSSMDGKPALIIASDQSASVAQKQLTKPGSRELAVEQLAIMSGQTITFFTSLCLLNAENQQRYEHIDTTEVKLRNLTLQEIERYIDLESPLNCAGSFKCEGLGLSLFERISSNDPTALIGLPLIHLNLGLIHFGYQVLNQDNE